MKHASILFLLAFISCTNNMGTSDEVLTGTRSSAVIYEPDGKTPAKGAVVKIFSADAVDGQYVSRQTTGNTGRYSIKGLSMGNYNIWAEKDSSVLFQNNVVIAAIDTTLRNDTLEPSSTVTGFIDVQPQDDPRSVTIRVVGLDKSFSNIDKTGRFTLKGMAEGTYSLLLQSTLPNYTPTRIEISVDAGKNDTIAYSLPMTFTGIPIVTSLAAKYDTLKGSVLLSWNPTDYRDLQAYLVYRDFYDSVVFSTVPFAAPSDTFFIDRIYDDKTDGSRFSHSDTNDYRFRYRVAIRNNSNTIGPTFRDINIVAASPYKVKTSFSFSTFHVGKGIVAGETFDTSFSPAVVIAGSASINDVMLVIAHVSNPTRGFAQFTWRDSVGNVLRTAKCDSTRRNAIDSVACTWPTLGVKYVTCTVTDNAGIDWIDTARVLIVKDEPTMTLFIRDSVSILRDTALSAWRYALGDTIRLHIFFSDTFGKIAGTEWDFWGNVSQPPSGVAPDTFAIAPSNPGNYRIVARAFDDDGNSVSDTLMITTGLFAPASSPMAFTPRMRHKALEFQGKLWIYGGIGYNESTSAYDSSTLTEIWSSEDGVKWIKANSNLPGRTGQSMLAFNNKLWLIGGVSGHALANNDVWNSSDGTTWTCIMDTTALPRRSFHSCVAFNNKMWVIGGLVDNKRADDVWYSAEGIQWVKAADTLSFLTRCRLFLANAGKLWAIAGRDTATDTSLFYGGAWYSTDGIAWTRASGSPEFFLVEDHDGLVFDNKMWVIGDGNLRSGSTTMTIWNSADGQTWTSMSGVQGFSDRLFYAGAVFRNRMWIFGGMTYGGRCSKEIWRSGPLTK